MDFSKKLQKLRKDKNLTQEQLAEKLYISRTAISKWESGRGYPNLDSLKDLANIFNTSIDELLSSEEIINISTKEKINFFNKIINLCYSLFDIIAILFIFIPLYPSKIENYVYSVSLITQNDLSNVIRLLNIVILTILTLIGIFELVLYFINHVKFQKIINIISLIFETFSVLYLAISRQSYLITIILILLIIKAILFIKNILHIHKI